MNASVPSEQVRDASSLIHSRNFSRGSSIASFTDSTMKWCYVFVASLCFLIWLRTLEKQNTFCRHAWEKTRATPTKNSTQIQKDLWHQSLPLLPFSPHLNPTLSVIVYLFVLGIICFSVWIFRHFPCGADGTKILARFHINTPRSSDKVMLRS